MDLGHVLGDGRLTFRQKVASVINEDDDLLMQVTTLSLLQEIRWVANMELFVDA